MIKLLYFAVFSYCCGIGTGETVTCTTPNGEEAFCLPLHSCPSLKTASDDPSCENFLDASVCPGKKFRVCCGSASNFTQTATEEPTTEKPNEEVQKKLKREYALKHLLPSKAYCGLQHWDDYFHTGNETEVAVDEFPWLLDVAGSQCAGVLISDQYALTSAICTRIADITALNVGQHNRLKNVSCTDTKDGTDCTDPVKTLNIQERFEYVDSVFGLVRLEKKIHFSDYVRPICLPLSGDDGPKIDDSVATSGWGVARDDPKANEHEKIKKKTNYKIKPTEECLSAYSQWIPYFENEVYCMYPTEKNKSYSCNGDDGGPMMYKRKLSWFVGGLVSYPGCENVLYSAAAKITPEVIDWILDNMRP